MAGAVFPFFSLAWGQMVTSFKRAYASNILNTYARIVLNACKYFHSLLYALLPDPGIEPGSPALQADSLPSEPPGKFNFTTLYSIFKYINISITYKN